MKRISIALFAILIISGSIFAQDQIVKTSGEEIFGKVVRVNALDVVYKKKDNLDGPEYSELKANILFVKYENGQKDIFTTGSTPVVRDVSTICEPIKRKNSVFFEAGGNGLIASLNYERRFFSNKKNNFGTVKVGIGPFATINILNITSTYNIGDGMNFFEIGGGAGVVTNRLFNDESSISDNNYFYFTPVIGYRRQSARGFLLRAFLTTVAIREERSVYLFSNGYYPNYENQVYYRYYPFLGISIGYSF